MQNISYQPGIRQLFRLESGEALTPMCLDQFLVAEIPQLSQTDARKIIDLGGVHLNGRRARTRSIEVRSRDKIEVFVDGLPLDIFRLTDDHILFQDSYLIVLNKPAGIETQPTHARYKGSLYDALLAHLGPVPGQRKHELGMVQRLYRGTSGVMVFSIHRQAHKGLSQIFLEHRLEKRYLALTARAPEPAIAEIRSMLARSHRLNRMVSVERGGKDAITGYKTICACPEGALIEVELLTGRSHQIRVHLSEAGSALLGDTLYGGLSKFADLEIQRPMLHAFYLAFEHPITGESMRFELPLPPDMQRICDKIFA
ncbi:MAG: RluA family pseudouridine synthase [Geopsychrobacter sp.]|nr:RluA family pseudouridine synthase [Geopsychrobacter sp.]